jgi:transcriptional regulator with GAF, ATPase, and Fis domain
MLATGVDKMRRRLEDEVLDVPEDILEKWQSIVDIMAHLLGVPAGLIMRITGPDIEVFVSSRSGGNPYHPGDREHLLGSGLYCETVIRTKDKLLVRNAPMDDDWKHNPDIELGMISYLGFPIVMPDGQVFGTICVLDRKANAYSETYGALVAQFKDLVESHLKLLHLNRALESKNQEMQIYLDEINTLRGIVPMCALCKKIRDDKGAWHPVEHYLYRHPQADISHTYCPECFEKHFGIPADSSYEADDAG